MRLVLACISLLAVTVSLSCAARQPIVAPRPHTVDEVLPEAILKVPPEYPVPARQADVQGTVMVQALVGQDGRVMDTHIVKSIPMLDAAAAAAVRQWLFKPALADSQPVTVWITVPVKFALH